MIAIQADGYDTRNAYTLLQMSAPASTLGPPAHVHPQENEASHVQQRRTRTGQMVTIFSPSGMEGCFREMIHRGHLYQTASK